MYCSSCGTQNIPTDRRCVRCGASLFGDPVGGSAKLKALTGEMDQKVYSWIGSLFGFFLVAGLLHTLFADLHLGSKAIYGSAAFAGIVFGALGRWGATLRDGSCRSSSSMKDDDGKIIFDKQPDPDERMVRLVCGGILGLIVGCWTSLRWQLSLLVGIGVTMVAVLSCANGALKYGDEFWYKLLGK